VIAMFRKANAIIAKGRRIDNAYSRFEYQSSMELKNSNCCCKNVEIERTVPTRHATAINI